MVVLRRTIGDVLRDERRGQQRTLREVSSTARVSLGYLSEVERGQKEASSELLASICTALDVPLSQVLGEVTRRIADEEGVAAPRAQFADRPHTERRYAAEGIVPAPVPEVAPEAAVDELDSLVDKAVDSVVDQAIDSALGELPSADPREFAVELEGLPADLELILRRRLVSAA
jgi:transcriptional regulator with XRE-family HTH domain